MEVRREQDLEKLLDPNAMPEFTQLPGNYGMSGEAHLNLSASSLGPQEQRQEQCSPSCHRKPHHTYEPIRKAKPC
jgi:hypothetical protein